MEEKFRIELRQIDVKGLNARHYFWVKTRVLKDGKKVIDTRVLGEMHGFAVDPKTGEPKVFSVTGDNLGFVASNTPSKLYLQSRSLPHVVALEGSGKEIETHWDAGQQMGRFVDKTRTNYFPLDNNSNAMATTIGKAMGLRPRKILDPRVGGEEVQPFTPGLGLDLSSGHANAPQVPPRERQRDVGGFGKLDLTDLGEEQTLDPFVDPFRDHIPF